MVVELLAKHEAKIEKNDDQIWLRPLAGVRVMDKREALFILNGHLDAEGWVLQPEKSTDAAVAVSLLLHRVLKRLCLIRASALNKKQECCEFVPRTSSTSFYIEQMCPERIHNNLLLSRSEKQVEMGRGRATTTSSPFQPCTAPLPQHTCTFVAMSGAVTFMTTTS